MPGKIPDRWEDYSPFGKPIKGTRFIACKVPLEYSICQKLKDEKLSLTPEDMVQQLESQNWQLGLLIDLTNTDRYYRKGDIHALHVEHEKVKTEGHVIPNRRVIKRFTSLIDSFLKSNEDNEKLIGVHCTHGVNRTGYLICRYMIANMSFKAEDAIQAFNEARGHDLERENYLEDLRKGNWPDLGEEEDEEEEEEDDSSYHRNSRPWREREGAPGGNSNWRGERDWQSHRRRDGYQGADRYPQRGADRFSQQGNDRYPQRGADRYQQRGAERYPQQGRFDTHRKQSFESYPQRSFEQPPQRGFDQYSQRGFDQHSQRGDNGYSQQGAEKYYQRGSGRYPQQVNDRNPQRDSYSPRQGGARYPRRGGESYPRQGSENYPEQGVGKYPRQQDSYRNRSKPYDNDRRQSNERKGYGERNFNSRAEQTYGSNENTWQNSQGQQKFRGQRSFSNGDSYSQGGSYSSPPNQSSYNKEQGHQRNFDRTSIPSRNKFDRSEFSPNQARNSNQWEGSRKTDDYSNPKRQQRSSRSREYSPRA